MKLEVIGAVDSVTGSKSCLEIDDIRIVVDSGLFQGMKDAAHRNREVVIKDKIDFVFLTHAHLDHSGYLPVLAKNGFRGLIYCTVETRELVEIILNDSVKIQENELKEGGQTEPLYTAEDVELVMSQIIVVQKGVDYKKSHFHFRFSEAGHILGAASVTIWNDKLKIAFSGDIGRRDDILHLAPQALTDIDYLVLESTYGDRRHKRNHIIDDLQKEIDLIIQKKGVLLIPSFAVARTQQIILYLHEIFEKSPQHKIKVYVDSPMAIKATKVYEKYIESTKISKEGFKNALGSVKLAEFESTFDKVRKQKPPFIVVSSSGMLGGGMIMKYLDMFIHHSENTILFSGYQGEGSLGRKILDGETGMELNGHILKIRAEIHLLEGLSAHADQDELIDYACHAKGRLKKVFLNHGEKESMLALQGTLSHKLKIPVVIPEKGLKYDLI